MPEPFCCFIYVVIGIIAKHDILLSLFKLTLETSSLNQEILEKRVRLEYLIIGDYNY
jgi:hypothetical protein